MLVIHLSYKSKAHKKALEAAKKEGNKWYKFPPGASSKGSKCGYRVILHQDSSSFKYFSQGEENKCVFSSLASALSYKGFHEAAKVISNNIEGSLKEKDAIIFATNLLSFFYCHIV